MTRAPTVTVAGGGLAGLVAARHLASAGVDVTLYERREEVGGRVRTLERDGYRFDRGFQVLFTEYPAVRAELDLDALALRRFAPGAIIARDGRRSTLSDPFRDPKALPSTLFNTDVTVRDKLEILRLRRDLAGRDADAIFAAENADRSIEAYLRDRGFSDRFLENFAAPFYGGITLDRSLSTSSRVFEYTFRTLSRGSIAVPATGMAQIPTQLATKANAEGAVLETGRAVTAIEPREDGVAVTVERDAGEGTAETLEPDAVVVATDPPTARELTGLESIPTEAKGCVTQYYAMPEGTDLGTGGRLVLNAEGGVGPNHVVPHSAVAPEYAPDDATLLSATYLGEPEADDETLLERTRAALDSWYPERLFEELELCHTERVPFAQFAQPPGIHDDLPGPRGVGDGVYLAGDYTQWSSIQGALESGRRAAEAVTADLG